MHIIIIDDEKLLSTSLKKKLVRNDYTVSLMHSYSDFLQKKSLDSDLYIIDISLGDGCGFDIIKKIRASPSKIHTPILLISGYDDIETKIKGLDIGADDYMVKPFHPDEMLARIRSLMKRQDISINSEVITYKNISLNLKNREVSQKGKSIYLTRKEKQIFEFFVKHQETLITKDRIIEKLWKKKACTTTDNTVNVTICNLRKKLGSSFHLETKLGEGYILLM